MRAHTLLVLVAFSIYGCAHEGHKTEPPAQTRSATAAEVEFQKLYPMGVLCASAACTTVMVTVKPGCRISADPPTLGMTQGHRNVITWKIDPSSTGNATFARNGINPKNPAAWRREFEDERPGTTQFTWLDTNPHDNNPNNQKRKLGYNVDVIQEGRPCPRFDPIIINDY